MRTPFALRVSPAVRAAAVRRALAEGVDPSGPLFAQWLGDLLIEGLPAVVADILRTDEPPNAAAPLPSDKGAADTFLTASTVARILPGGPDDGDAPGAAAR